ncbi:MAG: bifunctional nuclease family protein [Treponema sp.]|jgi:bifunctional DNase/RNase|nr:bifunctional nuclease family protein [Treponema sp.]
MDNMLEVEIWTIARTVQGNAVLLRPLGSDTVVPVFIGQLETQSILFGLGDVKVKRPLTSDLLLETIGRLGCTLFRAEVHEIRDDIFYARLLVSGREYPEAKPLILDCRPSDALALAARCKCPVYVAPGVVEKAGIPTELIIDETGSIETGPIGMAAGMALDNEDLKASIKAKRRKLQADLDEMVVEENYERAAEIRDLITLLDKELNDTKEGGRP